METSKDLHSLVYNKIKTTNETINLNEFIISNLEEVFTNCKLITKEELIQFIETKNFCKLYNKNKI